MNQMVGFGGLVAIFSVVALTFAGRRIAGAIDRRRWEIYSPKDIPAEVNRYVIRLLFFGGVGIIFGLTLLGNYLPMNWIPVWWVTGGMILGYQICAILDD